MVAANNTTSAAADALITSGRLDERARQAANVGNEALAAQLHDEAAQAEHYGLSALGLNVPEEGGKALHYGELVDDFGF